MKNHTKKKQYLPRQSLRVLRGQAVRNRVLRWVDQHPDCKIVVSTSGGKDSAALLNWAVGIWGAERIQAAHAYVDVDWHETLKIVKTQCHEAGVKLHIVERDDGMSLLDMMMRGRLGQKNKIWKQTKWSGPGNQACTHQIKLVPLDKLCKSLGDNVIVLIGERAEESDNRARKEVWRAKYYSRLKKNFVKASPIYDKLIDEIWVMHKGLTRHPIYAFGHSRASCAICIYSKKPEILLAAKHAPDIVARFLVVERNLTHTFRAGLTIAQILIEGGIDPQAIIDAHINDPEVAKYNVGTSTQAIAIKNFGGVA